MAQGLADQHFTKLINISNSYKHKPNKVYNPDFPIFIWWWGGAVFVQRKKKIEKFETSIYFNYSQRMNLTEQLKWEEH